MSKKRFVEFYLAACMKAATSGRVTRLIYTYTPEASTMPDQETIAIYFDVGSCLPVIVTGKDLLEISKAVLGALV